MKVGFIGGGKMAEALFSRMLQKEFCLADALMVSDVDAGRLSCLQDRYGVEVSDDNAAVMTACDVVVLAVKPQELGAVLSGMETAAAGKLVISIAAGKRLAFFTPRLPSSRLVRVMPNLACQVGQGMSVVCGGAGATEDDLRVVRQMFECCGRVVVQEESLFDVVTALSGSGPAFFAYVLDALTEAAVKRGMDFSIAQELALQTMLGTAVVMQEADMPPAVLMANVASKGGTTAAGLEVLDQSDIREVLDKVLGAAADRSAVLSS